jgi:hypothetical protein
VPTNLTIATVPRASAAFGAGFATAYLLNVLGLALLWVLVVLVVVGGDLASTVRYGATYPGVGAAEAAGAS